MVADLVDLRAVSTASADGAALSAVSLRIAAGTVHGVLGENLSGASALLAVVAGRVAASSGTVTLAPDAAPALISGDPSLVAALSIAENVYLGNERSSRGFLRLGRMNASAAPLLASLGLVLDPSQPAGRLSAGQRRVVEVARGIARGSRVLLLDDPFAGVDASERALVARALRGASRRGAAVVVASHRVAALWEVADVLTVLSRGSVAATAPVERRGSAAGASATGASATGDSATGASATGAQSSSAADAAAEVDAAAPLSALLRSRLVEAMAANVPAPVRQSAGEEWAASGPVAFECRGWTVGHPLDPREKVVDDVSIAARPGEIVGLAGLAGSGADELLLSLFGRSFGTVLGGTMAVDGATVSPKSASEAIAARIGYSSEAPPRYDVQLLGGIPTRLSPSAFARLGRLGVLDRNRSYGATKPQGLLGGLAGRVGSAAGAGAGSPRRHREALEFWLAAGQELRPRVVLLDRPTAALAQAEASGIRALIVELAARGTAVVLTSNDLAELLSLADRVYTMADGCLTAEFPSAGTTPAALLAALV